MLLYYFTSAHWGIDDLKNRWIKVSRFEDLNDPFEVFGADRSHRPHRAELRAFRDKTNKNNGLICFTRGWQNPVTWGHYGDRHRGISLGFKITSPRLVKVIYARTPLAVEIDPESSGLVLNAETKANLLRTKFREWKYERERRLILPLGKCIKRGKLFFWQFDRGLVLRHVVIGPQCPEKIGAVRKLLADFEPEVKVTKARLAFRSFNVVENKAATKAG